MTSSSKYVNVETYGLIYWEAKRVMKQFSG